MWHHRVMGEAHREGSMRENRTTQARARLSASIVAPFAELRGIDFTLLALSAQIEPHQIKDEPDRDEEEDRLSHAYAHAHRTPPIALETTAASGPVWTRPVFARLDITANRTTYAQPFPCSAAPASGAAPAPA